MHTITKLRLHLSKSRNRFVDIVIGLLLGLAILPVFKGIIFVFELLDHAILIAVCSLFLVMILGLIGYIILLRNKLNSRERIIKDIDPTMNIEAQEEYNIGWDEAGKYLKKIE